MPLAKSQVLILSDLHPHSREPVIEGSLCHKLEANPKTMVISASTSPFVTTLETKISQSTITRTTSTPPSTKISSLSPADDQTKLDITNPWGPMFKDYEAFIDAHVF